MLSGYAEIFKVHLQIEIAKLLREYCVKGDLKVITSSVTIQFALL